MSWPADLALHLTRVVQLLALSVVPSWPSPEPLAPAPLALHGVLAASVLVALLALSARFASWLGTPLAKTGAGLVWVAVAAAIAAALYYAGPRAPLGRGVPVVALPAWAALAVLAAASAEQWLGSSFKHKRMGSAIVVLGAGAAQLVRAGPYLGSQEQMWWAALRRDAAHERAVEELARPVRAARRIDDLAKLADRCLRMHPLREGGQASPATCACLDLRIEAGLRSRGAEDAEGAVRDAQALLTRCADRKRSRAAVAEALARAGRIQEAEQEVKAGLDEGGDPAPLRYAMAIIHERAGRYPEALREAGAAVDAGAGREARLLAGALAILVNDLDGAVRWLEPLAAKDPSDAEARYNLALIADKRGDYNGARQGYLAALKIDPRNADARYNLTLLTLRAGVIDEARHHARKFADMFPDDPRGTRLARMVGTGK